MAQPKVEESKIRETKKKTKDTVGGSRATIPGEGVLMKKLAIRPTASLPTAILLKFDLSRWITR